MKRTKRLAFGSTGSDSKLGGCIGYGFFAIFALAGLGMFIGLLVVPVLRIVDAQGWTETRCTITSSSVASHSSDDGTTYSIEVRYTYAVDGTSHTGDRYNWGSGSSSGYDGKKKVVDSMPVGSTVTCWVDPDSPADSVIRRGPGWYLLWGLFSLPFLAVGLGGLWFLIRAPKIARKAERLAGQSQFAPSSSTAASTPSSASNLGRTSSGSLLSDRRVDPGQTVWPDRPPQAPFGTLDLSPQISRGLKLAGLLFFAAIWNGILGFMIYQVFGDSDDRLRVETLFFLPFVLVGVFLLLFCLHQFLALFNPVVRLQLDTGQPEVGTRFQLQWRLSGSSGRLKNLRISVEGREAATYRRGTNTTTDRHTFYQQDLVTVAPVRTDRGAAEVTLPGPSLPTWESRNNKIEWRLLVQGDIPFWPDVSEEFALVVAPPAHLARTHLPSVPVRSLGDDADVPGSVEIELDRDAFEPGETVEGTVHWQKGNESIEAVLVSLLWLTEGKGTEDTETVAQTKLDAYGSSGEQRFALQLTDQPWTFSGTLVSVVWLVEASLEPSGDLHRVYLTSAPGGTEVRV